MLNIHVHTQYCENYGDSQNPFWKFKGGSTYVLTGFNHPLSDGIGAAAQSAVNSVRPQIECDNDACREYIIDWEFAPVDALTQDEQDQQNFDGRVSYPSKRIAL